MRNLHKLYYKDYFTKVDFKKSLDSKLNEKAVLESNRLLTKPVLKSDLPDDKLEGYANATFILQVRYPGLVTGIGIRHEASVKGEFKLGMHFDYTTGLPVIYGSSVKGVLRAYFKDIYEKKEGVDVDALVADIFDGKDYSDRHTELENRKFKPMCDRDVFFDAIIVDRNEKGKILDSDALAPHGGDKHDDPFAEPTPIPFVKIASGVTMKFRFSLKPTAGVMSVEDKKNLFIKILTTYGVGAKTNVGFGQLIEVKGNLSF